MERGTCVHSKKLCVKLPIAPNANHRLSRGADEKIKNVLLPAEALAWVQALRQGGKDVKSIELCGPGDVLASADITMDCLALLQPEICGAELSLTSLGLGKIEVALELKSLGVKTVNLLVDTVCTKNAMKLYTWIRPGQKTLPLTEGAEILVCDQSDAVIALTAAGIRVVIRTTLVSGVNDGEVSAIAEKMAQYGAAAMEICGESGIDLEKLSLQASQHLPATVYHPGSDLPPPGMPDSCAERSIPGPTGKRPNVAVVSTNGMDVDMHLGQAAQVLIYGPREDGLVCLLMARKTPVAGANSKRWQTLAKTCLHDCFALLATHAGDAPRKEFTEMGIQAILTEDNIEGLIDVLYGGVKKKKCKDLVTMH
jgi:nitrogen fixation protein NifB